MLFHLPSSSIWSRTELVEAGTEVELGVAARVEAGAEVLIYLLIVGKN